MEQRIDGIFDRLGFNLMLVVKVAIIVVLAFLLERVLRFLLRRAYLRGDKDHEDRTRYRFLRNAIRFMVGILALAAIIHTIPPFRHLAVTLFAGAGILVAVLGLAAQGAFSNIISGIFIVSFKPFRVGDQISVAGQTGVVEDITLRHTVLVTPENRRVIMPNSKISDETIINNTVVDPTICEALDVQVDYGADIDRAMELLRTIAEEHPQCLDRRTAAELEAGEPKVLVRVMGFADSGVQLRAFIWAADVPASRAMRSDLHRTILLRFRTEGIEIPYPHRVLMHRNDPPIRHEEGTAA